MLFIVAYSTYIYCIGSYSTYIVLYIVGIMGGSNIPHPSYLPLTRAVSTYLGCAVCTLYAHPTYILFVYIEDILSTVSYLHTTVLLQ